MLGINNTDYGLLCSFSRILYNDGEADKTHFVSGMSKSLLHFILF